MTLQPITNLGLIRNSIRLMMGGLLLVIFMIPKIVIASHLFGGEIGYTHITGNTYEITLTLYGDCSGQAYPNLFSSSPSIAIYNGNSGVANLNLSLVGTPGLEVTPVCPAEQNNTLCANPGGGTIPGVSQFIFKGTYTLNSASANWRFIFTGNLGGNSGAGRSQTISNINQGSGFTTMSLEATLNNLNGPNNSAIYSTIPTPFVCINLLQQYNQGGIDPDGDGLSYALTPALNGNTGSAVNYQSGYTFQEPLQTAPGSFTFSSANGQMTFLPNMVQNSVVVSIVTETRNGVVVGTSMREMTIVVLSNCNNQSPGGSINSTTGGTIDSFNVLRICNADSLVQFGIQCSDPDGGLINVSISGLPVTASSAINGNQTTSPVILVNYLVPQPFIPGQQTFYVTYQDDGCPLSSKQTIAYTIILEDPFTAGVLTETVSCFPGDDGSIQVNGSSTNGNIQYSLNDLNYQSSPFFSGLSIGVYSLTLRDSKGCKIQYPVSILPSTIPVIDTFRLKQISCRGLADGEITLYVNPSGINYTYTLLPLGLSQSSATFTAVQPGNYNMVVSTDKACRDTISFTMEDPPQLEFTDIDIQPLYCDLENGRILASSNFTDGLVFTLSPGIRISATGLFENLDDGYYTLSVRNANGCVTDSLVYVGVDPNQLQNTLQLTHLTCKGTGIEGKAEVISTGGIPPYTYLWSGKPEQTGAEAMNLYYGHYTVQVTDARGCQKNERFYINPGNCCEDVFAPNAFTPNSDGVNERWGIKTTAGMDIELFAIFNRWGQKVWQAYDQREEWDGKFAERDAESGTYYFMLYYTCLTDGKKYMRKGDILLIR